MNCDDDDYDGDDDDDDVICVYQIKDTIPPYWFISSKWITTQWWCFYDSMLEQIIFLLGGINI